MTGRGLEIATELRTLGEREVAVLHADGEVDMHNADDLAAALRAPRVAAARAVILDLIRVPFMDSSGLRVLLLACEEQPGGFALVLSPGSPVRRLLELTEVAERIPTFGSEEEAVEAVGSGSLGS